MCACCSGCGRGASGCGCAEIGGESIGSLYGTVLVRGSSSSVNGVFYFLLVVLAGNMIAKDEKSEHENNKSRGTAGKDVGSAIR